MSSGRQIMVDDANPQIQYIGNWFVDAASHDGDGVYGPALLNSEHATQDSTASLSFSFEGTSVAILGTIDSVYVSEGVAPWTCSVDGISIGSVPFDTPVFDNNWPLCMRDGIKDGIHSLTMNITNNTQTVWFDVLVYTPDPSVQLKASIIKIPHNDPDIHYGPSYRPMDIGNATFGTGDQLEFEFVGKSLGWVGWTPSNVSNVSASATYSVDGGPPVEFLLPAPSQIPAPLKLNQVFFTTPAMVSERHTLVVTYNGSTNSVPLTLDYLYVVNATAPNTTTSNPMTSSSSSASSASGPQGTSSTKDSIVGPLVGGIIGGLAVLIAIVYVLLWHRRRNQSRTSVLERPYIPSPRVDSFSNVTPFHTSPGHLSLLKIPSASPSVKSRLPTHSKSQASVSSPMSSGPTSPTTTANNQSQSAHEMVWMPRAEASQTLVHQDSGLRVAERPRVVSEVPPVYSPH